MAVNNPRFDRIRDNPICLQVPWYKDEEKLRKWEHVSRRHLICDKYITHVHLYKLKTGPTEYFFLLSTIVINSGICEQSKTNRNDENVIN